MQGQIILIGYDKDAGEKLLVVEGTYEGSGDDLIDVVRFPNLDVSIERELLLDTIRFLKTH